MEEINLILIGFGRVGQAFFDLLKEKYDYCGEKYGLALELRALVRRKGTVLLSSTQQVLASFNFTRDGLQDSSEWSSAITLSDLLEKFSPGVVVDCTPSDLKTGEPGYSLMKKAIEKGWHVVSASKGALVVNPVELADLARKSKVAIKISGATAAALPALDVGLSSLAGTEILAIEGILNGTTNYILTRMTEGLTYNQALEEAREKGIAESDPSLDVEGWDTAVKMILIANQVLGTTIKLKEAKVTGIKGISREIVEKASSLDKVLKLLGKCYREGHTSPWEVEVGLALLGYDHPLAMINGTNKGIIFYTDSMGWVEVAGGKSDPRGAAAALLKDIINIYYRYF
jgi:homoserine dehydrogenase